jgi:hypothetical protein
VFPVRTRNPIQFGGKPYPIWTRNPLQFGEGHITNIMNRHKGTNSMERGFRGKPKRQKSGLKLPPFKKRA